ncbi:hypothetical protein HUF18_08175 [Thalassolituus sp. ST750PaO-4]|nr:hypothetical protein [Thalassolituus sp. ST750PaO-4]MCA6059746.1 hypothetical protein [Thalassolituus sp. ST750PaO-4]
MDAATVATITGGVDYATIVSGIGTVGAAVATVYIALRGVKMLLAAIRS